MNSLFYIFLNYVLNLGRFSFKNSFKNVYGISCPCPIFYPLKIVRYESRMVSVNVKIMLKIDKNSPSFGMPDVHRFLSDNRLSFTETDPLLADDALFGRIWVR